MVVKAHSSKRGTKGAQLQHSSSIGERLFVLECAGEEVRSCENQRNFITFCVHGVWVKMEQKIVACQEHRIVNCMMRREREEKREEDKRGEREKRRKEEKRERDKSKHE